MNKKHNNNKNGRFNGRQKNQTKKSFNPTNFINTPIETVKIPEVEIQHSFSDFLISNQLKSNIAAKGYDTPTPIQDKAIPLVLEGRDIIGIANTGTGKTGAFLIPLLNKVINNRSQKVLIIAPTRELAVQIEDELMIFAKNLGIYSVLCIGGLGLGTQIRALRDKHDFVIGTPGRILDLKKQGKINLYAYNNVVLDEVDRMLDMGFIKDIRSILSFVPQNRQSLFFSATIPQLALPIIHSFLKNPQTISVKSTDTIEGIKQDVIKVRGKQKADVLRSLLKTEGFDKVLVFGRTKWGMEKLSKALIADGFRASAIHGNKNQNQRQRALDEFKNGRLQILLATDIASRGLDIEDVTHVINYDPPASQEDYIHRIGRTGRADKKGIAITFVE